MSTRTKKRERKRKTVVTNEDIVHAVDDNGNGDAKTSQRGSIKRRQTEPANAKLRNQRTKQLSRKRSGESGRDEISGQYQQADKRKIFVNGKLKMLPLRTWAKQHDDEVDSVANANPQPPQAQLPFPQIDVPPPPPPQPQAKPKADGTLSDPSTR